MTSESAFDPTAPLAGPPEPWASTSTPSTRLGPPYHMTDMIAAEPSLARRIVERLVPPDSSAASLAAEIRTTLDAGDPVILTGCGTSEHAALAAAEILGEAARSADLPNARVSSEQAFELSLAPPTRGLVIGISHEGGTTATNAALRAARDAGRSTAVITVSRRSPAGALAGHRRRDRGARPWLVPHRRLSQPDRRGRGRWLASLRSIARRGRHRAAARVRHSRRERRGTHRRRPGRLREPPRDRLRVRPSRRSRAGAQGRRGVLAAVGIPRPGDLPARTPARDRRDDRPRPRS